MTAKKQRHKFYNTGHWLAVGEIEKIYAAMLNFCLQDWLLVDWCKQGDFQGDQCFQ